MSGTSGTSDLTTQHHAALEGREHKALTSGFPVVALAAHEDRPTRSNNSPAIRDSSARDFAYNDAPLGQHHQTMKYLLFIALGGALGAVSRYSLANWVHGMWEGPIPWGTLLVNVMGSAAIGVVFVLIERQLVHPDWRSVLMVGFLGAFTTFSTFSLEAIGMFESGHTAHALGYMAVSAV